MTDEKFHEIFRAGKYPQRNVTAEDIQEIAKNYDPKFCEAPISIFHWGNDFAYGWVSGLKAEGDRLMASFKDVSDDLKEYVAKKMLKRHSIELYEDLDGKGLYLKGLAMLGKDTPAVKGMEPISFKEAEAVEYNFKEDPAFVKELALEYYQAKTQSLETELDDEKSKSQNFESQQKQLEFQQRLTGFETFLDQKSEEGSLPPVLRDDAVALFKELDPIQEGSGDSKPVDTLKNFLSKLKPLISFEETPDGDTEEVDIPTGEEIRNYVEEQRKVGKQLSFSEAQFLLTQKKKRN